MKWQIHSLHIYMYMQQIMKRKIYKPRREKNNILHKRKQRRRTLKLISAFEFAKRIVQYKCTSNPSIVSSECFLVSGCQDIDF